MKSDNQSLALLYEKGFSNKKEKFAKFLQKKKSSKKTPVGEGYVIGYVITSSPDKDDDSTMTEAEYTKAVEAIHEVMTKLSNKDHHVDLVWTWLDELWQNYEGDLYDLMISDSETEEEE